MLVIVLLALSVCVVLVILRHLKEAKSHKLPPAYPGGLPIIGHTHVFAFCDNQRIWLLLKNVSETAVEKGGVIYLRLGTDIYYCITDPEDAYVVANTCLQKHFAYDLAQNWLGQGLITASGEIYRRHRKLLNPGYTISTVHSFLKIFNSQAKKLVNQMIPYSQTGPFDLLPMIKKISLESTCLTTFGSDIKDNDFLYKYMDAVDEMLHIITQRFTRVYLQNNLINSLIGFKRQEDILTKTLNKLTTETIQQKLATLKNVNVDKESSDIIENKDIGCKTMLDLLVELLMDGLLTEQEVREELDTTIAAAYETTTHTFINIILLLGTYPQVQEKIYDELIQVIGNDNDVGKNDLQKLVYTKAVIKESLRVLPTTPVLPKYTDKEVKLSKSLLRISLSWLAGYLPTDKQNYKLRAGSQGFISILGIHRNAAWGPDADKFRPERWLDPASIPSNINCFAGFSMGKRACIGMTYATTFLSVMLVHLVRRYTWTADINKAEMTFGVTLKPITGHEIYLQPRDVYNSCVSE